MTRRLTDAQQVAKRAWRKKNYWSKRDKILAQQKEWRAGNKEKLKRLDREYYLRNPARSMLASAKMRSSKKNLPFDLRVDDIEIPDICPVLGIKLKPGKGAQEPGSPSLDRICPELGYVAGNVRVISYRANTLRGNGTSAEFAALYFDAKDLGL